jgi:tetratricopeptide (TPR) repeat protein
MRFVERRPSSTRIAALLLAGGTLALSACSSVKLAPDASAPAPASAPASASAPPAAAVPAKAPTSTASAASAAASAASAPAPQVPIDPQVQRAYDAAVALLRAGRADEAERAFRTLAQTHGLPGVHANLGLIERRAGHLDASASELALAVKLSPDQPAYLNQLGITERLRGHFAQAKAAYEHAIAVDPNHAAATLNLGILEDLYLGDAPRALELYTRYLALTPGGDPVVAKWVADVKNRKPAAGATAPAPAAAASAAAPAPARKEKE